MQNKDWDTGGEIWKKNEIDRVENYSKKYGIECHGVPLTVKWFLDLLEAAVKHEREVFAETLKNRLGDAIHPDDFESMRNLIDDVVKEQSRKQLWQQYKERTDEQEGTEPGVSPE